MMDVDFHCRTRIVFGAGSVRRVGELARRLPATRAMLVTDRGLVAAGHADRVRSLLEEAGLRVTLFADTHENPATADVEAAVAVARHARPDALVALGGGSAIDTAKGCNFVLTNGGAIPDYWGDGKAAAPMLPLLAIPTTAGTGSEVQRFALISDSDTHRKMACGDAKATPALALLDPELTLTCPTAVTLHAGIDALAHAIESAVCTRCNEWSLMLSTRAAAVLLHHLPQVFARPDDVAARSHVMWGSMLAGLAIENSMLGAAHACANPLTARHGLVHGHAVGLMLPHVMRHNAQSAAGLAAYARLAQGLGLAARDSQDGAFMPRLIEGVRALLEATQLPMTLGACGVVRNDLAHLAELAAAEWTGTFNPRPMTVGDFVALYEAAL